MRKPTFEQIPLFTGGYRLLTCELVWHLDGTSNRIEAGYAIKATDTLEVVEMGTLGVIGQITDTQWLGDVGSAVHQRALEDLRPFG